jgi:subtilase family serine protease
MANLRNLPLSVLATALLCSTVLTAQNVAPAIRIVSPIDESQLVTLKGNTPPAAIASNDLGAVSPDLPMPDLTLVLSRSPERQAAFDAFVAGQYDASSPDYHRWLTPQQIGEQFGPAPADISTITNWLTSHGFAIKNISADRMTIRFSGTAGQVQSTFHTQIHNLSSKGAAHFGNMTDPQIPAALAPAILGIKALHNFLPRPLHKLGGTVNFNQQAGKWQRVANAAQANSTAFGSQPATLSSAAAAVRPLPQFGINVPSNSNNLAYLEEDVAPYDFATIYNVLPAWSAGYTGSGQTIAIAGTSFITLSDVANFRSVFGLPAGLAPQQIDTGQGPAATECTSTSSTAPCGIGDLVENSLDVEWSGAVATGAQIKLVVTGQNSTGTIDTVYDSAQYVVNNLTAKILSVSYGECELGQGTAGNVAYEQLWQTAAAEGISVFVATGDSGSPSCDQGGDGIGTPYSAQYGLSVSGMASTPYNTAVGGTDFSWCKPVYNSTGSAITGCASSSTSQGSPAYWNTSNSGTNGASAAGYVPEIPWNDSCLNPIWASFIESIAPLVGISTPANPEAACNFVQNNWATIYNNYSSMLAPYIDTVGGSGGASNCVVNDGQNVSSCSSSTTNTGSSYGSIPLHNDGWVKPAWQTGVAGIPNDGVRDLPDVSFFAGDGSLNSATLICVSALGNCVSSGQLTSLTTEPTAQEVGGTSVATPQMAGVMALINQKSGAAQGLASPQLYSLATRQTYSQCSAESVTTSSSCYFNDIDQGTNAMPCDLGAYIGGAVYNSSTGTWVASTEYAGSISPNCTALNSGDTVGTLVSSGTTPGYNGATGFDLATGLGSLNVWNVVNAWVSDAGTATATLTLQASPTTITINQTMTVTATVASSGNQGTPTGTIVLTGGGYSSTQALSGGSATFNIPANSLTAGSDTLTVTYSGDSNYASTNKTVTVTVNVMTPTVTVSAPSSANAANPLNLTVTVSGPSGATAVPSGSVYLKYGSTTTASTALSGGSASFTIAANTLAAGSLSITADYSGDSNYAGGTGVASVQITQVTALTPTVTVTPATGSINAGQPLGVTVAVSGAGTQPTGTVTLKGGTYTSSATALSGGGASFTIPANSLTAGTATLTASYSGDSNYASGTGTGSVTVTQSVYALSATTPATIAPGASATSTVTGSQSSTGYTGTVSLTTCTATTTPTNASYVPTCAVSGTITYAAGTPSGSGTATILTTAASSAMLHSMPGSKGWMGAGGGAVLAFLAFLGIPARRKSWRAMLGVMVLMAVLGSLTACGGGSSSSGTSIAGTTAGAYTFTVTGTGSDPSSTQETATFTLTVN